MTDLEAVYAAILDEPDDDTHRLVYADALDDRGALCDKSRALEIRAAILHPSGPFGQGESYSNGIELVWRRGFPDETRSSTDAWKGHGRHLVREHPIRAVRLTDKRPIQTGANIWYWQIGNSRPSEVPAWLLDRAPFRWTDRRHPTADLAHADLSDLCLAWARAKPRASRKSSRKPLSA